MNFTAKPNKKVVKIMVMEDDPFYSRILSKHLGYLKTKFKGENVVLDYQLFDNSYEGLNNLDEFPDIVVLDYFLNHEEDEEITGFDVLLEIKKFKKDIRVLVMTSNDKETTRDLLTKYGADEYIIKSEESLMLFDKVVSQYIRTKAA